MNSVETLFYVNKWKFYYLILIIIKMIVKNKMDLLVHTFSDKNVANGDAYLIQNYM